jgi:hypothetical protein
MKNYYEFHELDIDVQNMLIGEELKEIRDNWLLEENLDEQFFVYHGFKIDNVNMIEYCIDCDEKHSFAKYPGFTEEENKRLLSVIYGAFQDAINPEYFLPNNYFGDYIFDKDGNDLRS